MLTNNTLSISIFDFPFGLNHSTPLAFIEKLTINFCCLKLECKVINFKRVGDFISVLAERHKFILYSTSH